MRFWRFLPLALVMGCGTPLLERRADLDRGPEQQSPDISNEEVKEFAFSAGKFYIMSDGFELNPNLVPAKDQQQVPLFSEETREGLLVFGFQFNLGQQGGSSLSHLCTSAYLFTEVDQRQIEYPFDNHEAAIFLRTTDGRKIEVGRYLPALDLGPITFNDERDMASLSRFTHPRLCEDHYASVCSIQIVVEQAQTAPHMHGHRVRLGVILQEQPHTLELLAETPSATHHRHTGHFGCHE